MSDNPRATPTLTDMPINPETARELSRAARQARSFTQRRDEYVVKAHAEGGSLREIGGLAGLTHRAIAKILERKSTGGTRNVGER